MVEEKKRENPWEWSCEGRGWRGCTSREQHRGREEACCKEYKQCVLIRAPWPDECTIVALEGFAARPASTHTRSLACAVYQMPRSQMKTNFSNLPRRDGLFSWHTNRGARCGAATAIRNTRVLPPPRSFRESSRVDRSNEPPHDARERSLLFTIEKEKCYVSRER